MHSPLPLYSPEQLRMLETRGIEACDGDAFALMARAGQAAWRCVLKHWPHAQRIVVACGSGNNGGDGYVLATHAQASGRDVRVLRIGPPATPLATRACADYLAAGGVLVEALGDADLIVDALFGIGLSRAPEAAVAALIESINAHPAPVLALDLPSGIDARCGAAPGAAIVADRCLQFIARHRSLRTGMALDHAGELELASLDLPATAFDGIAPAACAYRVDALQGLFPLRPRDSHKGRNGHVLCIGGEAGSGGAVMLAVDAALHCGAGLASAATRTAHVPALLARRPEAMAHAVEGVEALAGLLARADVLAIGPGLGQGAWGRALFDAVLACDKPRVFDADALNLLAAGRVQIRAGAVLTPHPGEAARLLGCSLVEVQDDRPAAALRLAQRYQAVVVLKGAGSLVTDGHTLCLCEHGHPAMAGPGLGDVLAGLIGALLAQGLAALPASELAVWLHARAGERLGQAGRGLLASELVGVIRELLEEHSPCCN